MPKKGSNDTEGNVLTRMNPVSQFQELQQNISNNRENVLSIVKNIGGLTKDIITSPAPCEMSKFVTDQVCKVNYLAIRLITGIDLEGFE